MSEAKAKTSGVNVGTAVAQYKESLRGCITSDRGCLKLIYNRETGRILGCHIFGHNACDLIAYGSDCVDNAYTIFDVLKFVFPAVTHHQLYQLAAMSAKKNMLKIGATYDFVILGAGPAGIQAAIEAAGRGRKVAIIDPKLVVTGAPTGAHSKCLREAALMGARTWTDVKAVIDKVTEKTAQLTQQTLDGFKVDVLRGYGSVVNTTTVQYTPPDGSPPQSVHFNALLIATGSKANRFPPVNFDIPGVFDSDSINNLSYIPEFIVLQGAGIIGLEYALIFSKLGAKAIIVETFEHFVPFLDSSVQEQLRVALEKSDVEVLLKTPIKSVVAGAGSTPEKPVIKVDIGDRILECDCLLSACGRSGVTTDIGLESLHKYGLKVGRGKFIETDEYGHTGVGNIYAAGDVAGSNLATLGQANAVRAVRKCFGSGNVTRSKLKEFKPSGVWTLPEIAWAGATEADAKKQIGDKMQTATVRYKESQRGCVMDADDGTFLKLVFNMDTGVVLGCHIFGEDACDLISYGAQVVNNEDTIFDMLKVVFPAVTYHQLYHLCCMEAKRRVIMLKG